MENLFEMKLEKSWVNQGNFDYNILKNPRIYVESFGKAFVQITICFKIEEGLDIIPLRDDTEITLTQGEVETVTIIPVENLGDNLENLFTTINEVFSSLHTYQKDKDYE